MYRFDKTAELHKAILTVDDEKSRAATKGTTFACFEQTLKTKSQSTIIDGAEGNTLALTLQTDDEIALTIEADDQVIFEGHKYLVVSVGSVRSLAYKNAREYLIGLH